MTTATPTAATPTTLVEVRTAERNRLHAAVAAAAAEGTTLSTALTAARTLLTAADAELAALDQEASRLRQGLTAATTGPERHEIELALDRNAWQRFRALRRRVDAADAVASLEAEVTRVTATAGTLAGELAAAEAALAQAQADAATATTSRATLVATVAQAKSSAAALDIAGANAALDVLLGSAAMRTGLADRLAAVAATEEVRRKAARDADAAVAAAAAARSPIDGGLLQAAATHATALAEIERALVAPQRVAQAAAAVAAVLALPLPTAEQEASTERQAIRKAAEAAAAGAPAGAPPPAGPTPLEVWALTVPATVRDPAVDLLVAEADLADVAAIDPDDLLAALDSAEKAAAQALDAQLTAQRAQDVAAAAAAAARDQVVAHEATAEDRRALAVSGN